MTFETVGYLPAARGQWHVRMGGGHVWFVNEDTDVAPQVLLNGEVRPVVDASEDATAPLIMPKVEA
jgi:hypothetical protein